MSQTNSYILWGVVMAILWGIFAIPTLFLFSSGDTPIINLLFTQHSTFFWKIIFIWAGCGFLSGLYLQNALLRMLDRIASERKQLSSAEKKQFHSTMSTGYALFLGAVMCTAYSYLDIPVDVILKSIWWRLGAGIFAAYLATSISLRFLYQKTDF